MFLVKSRFVPVSFKATLTQWTVYITGIGKCICKYIHREEESE